VDRQPTLDPFCRRSQCRQLPSSLADAKDHIVVAVAVIVRHVAAVLTAFTIRYALAIFATVSLSAYPTTAPQVSADRRGDDVLSFNQAQSKTAFLCLQHVVIFVAATAHH
jgi:hypothetical protein